MKATLVFFVTLLFALMLEALPLPGNLIWFRPEWVLLVILYWVIALPFRIGVGVAWVLGIMVDLLQGGVLGHHSLSYIIITFICAVFHQRLRMYHTWQQGFFVGILVGLSQLMDFLIDYYSGDAKPTFMIFIPALVTGALWPWSFIVLRSIRRMYSIR